jgi:hypothetical protein
MSVRRAGVSRCPPPHGTYHVAVACADQPTRNTFVNSETAALGPGTLHSNSTGHAIDVYFEAVDCNLGEALRRLHD